MSLNYAQFDGTGNIIMPNDSTMNPGTGDVSIGFWMKTTRQAYRIITKYIPLGSGIIIGADGASFEIALGSSSDYFDVQANPALFNTGQWVHVVATKGSVIKLYVNGEYIATGTSDGSANITNTEKLILGTYDASYLFTGSLDQFFIVHKELTSDEVSRIYNNSSGVVLSATDIFSGYDSLIIDFDSSLSQAEKTVSGTVSNITGNVNGGATQVLGGAPFNAIPLSDKFQSKRRFINRVAKKIQFRFGGKFTLRQFGIFNVQPEDNR